MTAGPPPSLRPAGLSTLDRVHLGGVAAASLVAGFLTNWIVWFRVGPGIETDALFASSAVPNFALSVVSGSLTSVLVPAFSRASGPEVKGDASGLALGVSGGFVVVAGLLYLLAPAWIPFMVPGFDASATTLTVDLARIQVWSMVGSGATGVLWALCIARQRVLLAEYSAFTTAAGAAVILWWIVPTYGVHAAAWMMVARPTLQALLLASQAANPSRASFHGIREAARRLVPLLAGATYYKTDFLVDRALASLTPPGGLSALHLGQQLFSGANQIVNRSIASPALPGLSDAVSRGDFRELLTNARRARWQLLQTAMFIFVACLAGVGTIILMGDPIGAAPSDEWRLLGLVLFGLGGYLIAGAMGQSIVGALYALGKTRTVAMIGSAGFTMGIVLKWMFVHQWGVAGIAGATSLYYSLNLLLMTRALNRAVASRAHE